jgi:glycyl-tRNA synthetase beta chain
MAIPFLLEIGVEEIPDWMIEPALDDLKRLFEELIGAHKLGGSVARMLATPRRLVLCAEGLVERQNDSEELVSGPPKAAARGAVEGFARKQGVTAEALETVTTAKGEYWGFRKKVAGRATADILAAELGALIPKISFPKTMYWTGKGGVRFIRPIRWIVALLGDTVVPFEVAGVKSGNTSAGHRRLGQPEVPVTIANYEQQIETNSVLVDPAKRRAKIEREMAALLTSGRRLKTDDKLLNTLVFLTEFPTPILGSFDPQYLALPAEVLVTVMRHHQRYFSLVEADGKLAPAFIAIMNTSADPEGLVRQGNERVLRARFNDARFFWEVDQHKTLAGRVDDLAHVTFQAKLGSYLEKTRRVTALARELAAAVGADQAAAERAATLLKCDLTTEMVKEFTDLQGVVGGLYARHQGEPEAVAQAIYTHYKPASMDDSIPGTLLGQVVALADKLDTLRGCFGIGLIPSGSKDPFALRRAAQGVVKILVEASLELEFRPLLAGNGDLYEFFADRIKYYFKDVRGFAYDEVNAALAAPWTTLKLLEARLDALKAVRPTENFEPLAASFKRIKNILRQAEMPVAAGAGQAATAASAAADTALLEAGPERSLYDAFEAVRAQVRAHASSHDYVSALQAFASLRPQVDLFFDKVLVNAPDAAVRRNRLNLLYGMFTEFSALADFSEIVTA